MGKKLSNAQYEGLANATNVRDGGFTARAYKPLVGSAPYSGLLVGQHEHSLDGIAAPISATQIRDYAESKKEALTQESHYLGGWNDPKKAPEKAISLDVARAYPNPTGIDAAAVDASVGKQDAIGVMAGGEYVESLPTMDPRRLLQSIKGRETFRGKDIATAMRYSDYQSQALWRRNGWRGASGKPGQWEMVTPPTPSED